MERLVRILKKNGVDVVLSKNPEVTALEFRNAHVSHALSVAEDTGIIFMGGEEDRRQSALSDHHVVVVRRDVILSDTVSAFLKARNEARIIFASNTPSKTADIEGTLIYGMHGAIRLTVILEGE